MSRMSTLLAVMAAAAAAVLASAGAAAAEIKGAAYADLDFGVDHQEPVVPTSPLSATGPQGADTVFRNHGSFWGLKGSASQDGMTVFGAFERWLAVDNSDETASLSTFYPVSGQTDLLRQAFAGVATAWGTVQYGTFTTAYAEAGRKLDPFKGTGVAGAGFGTSGFDHGQSALSSDALARGQMSGFPLFGGAFTAPVQGGTDSNQVQYTTPAMFGLTANVSVLFDENSGTSKRQDDYGAGLEWSGFGGVTAGAQYLDANSNVGNTGLSKGEEATRVYAGYTAQRFGANVSAERIDYNGNAMVPMILGGTGRLPDADYIQVNGWFGVLPSTRIVAAAGMENETGTEGTSYRIGVIHDCADNFTLNVVYGMYDAKDEQQPNSVLGTNEDTWTVSVGASYRFELGAMTTTH